MEAENTTLTHRQSPSIDQPDEAQAITITPRVDIFENQDEILLVADFPGVAKDALSVQLDRSELVIEGTQTANEHQAQPRLAFSRTFRVPHTVDPNGVSAELTQGVLKVHLAKSEAAKPRRIEVSASDS